MSSALVIASLATALTAQAGATDISQIGPSQIGGAAGSAAAISPLETPQASTPAPGAASATTQISPETNRSPATAQVAPQGRDAAGPDQLSKRDRSAGTTQVTGQRRTASAPPPLSSVHDGHVVQTVVVHGRDRCNPVEGQPLPADCANIVDQRPDDFAAPPPAGLTPDETILAGSPPRNPSVGDINGLTGNLTNADGGEAAIAAASLGVVTQTLPSTANTAPVLGTAVSSTVNAAAGSATAGLGSSILPGGIVVTVAPAPK
jgi:hypothetical protein